MAPSAGAATPSRLQFLDACRGLAVLSMLFANFVNVFLHRVPLALTHNYGDVLRALDFPAPIFQFLIGVSLVLFLDKRIRLGRSPLRAKLDAARRFVLLVLLGMLLDCVGALHLGLRWGVLQTLGLGGIVAAAVAETPTEFVAALAVALLGVFSGAFNGEVHATPQAALAFVPLTLGGLLVGRPLVQGRPADRLRVFVARATLFAAVAGGFAGVLYAAGVPFNKTLGTSSFVALAASVSAATLALTAYAEANRFRFPAWLLTIGANALTVWVLQYVLVYYPAWLVFPAWRRLPLLPGMIAIAATMALLGRITLALGRRGIRIPL